MDFGLLFWYGMISVPFELEQEEFITLIPAIPLPEKSQKECSVNWMPKILQFNPSYTGGGG